MKKIQLTKQGHQKIQHEHHELKSAKHPKAIERLQKARAMGDLSENSEYTAAKEDLAFVEGRIAELENILSNAEIVELEVQGGVVVIGSSVILVNGDSKQHFTIVGEFEADPQAKKLSHTSPIGRAILGKKKGEKVTVKVPAGEIHYHISEVK